MRLAPVCALALAISAGSAMAQTPCGAPHVLPAPFPRATITDQGLAIALHGQDFAMWPQDRDMQINADAGVVLYFSSGARCELTLTSVLEHGLRIVLPPARITAVEAAICDAQAGMCVPIRVKLTE